jgi:hypothetical protein
MNTSKKDFDSAKFTYLPGTGFVGRDAGKHDRVACHDLGCHFYI